MLPWRGSQRQREIAVRLAVGASHARVIVAMAVRESMRSVACGLVVGSVAAVVASRVVQSEYHGIRDLDVTTLAGAAALFVAAMLVASGLPALRAARFDPVALLKTG